MKSKWNKVFQDLSRTDAKTKGLNEDVVDFLRPSTEKAVVITRQPSPKLDIAIARRWPDAAEVRRAADVRPSAAYSVQFWSPGRQQRRQHLTVRFANTTPHVIGHGGDQEQSPVVNISRMRTRASRSQSHPAATAPATHAHEAGAVSRSGQAVRPPSITVVHIAGDEPNKEPRPGYLRRAPTGFGSQQDISSSEPSSPAIPAAAFMDGAHQPIVQRPVEGYKSGSPPMQSHHELSHFLETSSPDSRSTLRHHMRSERSEEGSALRGASQTFTIEQGEREQQALQPPVSPVLPSVIVPHRDNHHTASRQVGQQNQRHRDHGPNDDVQYYARSEPMATSPYQRLPVPNQLSRASVDEVARKERPSSQSGPHQTSMPVLVRPQVQTYAAFAPTNLPMPLPSSSMRGPNTGYFAPRVETHLHPTSVNQDGTSYRPSSRDSSIHAVSPGIGDAGSPDTAALADFALRVTHMGGVLQLTAEREVPAASVVPSQWLRCAVWWFFKARVALEAAARQNSRNPRERPRELLMQPHVDLAKAWWILSNVLQGSDLIQGVTLPVATTLEQALADDMTAFGAHMRALTKYMSRHQLMPPYDALIQGQDTTVWVPCPGFASDVRSILQGRGHSAPLTAFPLGDTREVFFYNRMFVDASINTDDAATDRVKMPCVLSIVRASNEYQTSMIIASQDGMINIRVQPDDGGKMNRGLTWRDVSWKARSQGVYLRLPRGFTLNVDFQESDFRILQNLVEYTSRTESSLRTAANETILYQSKLVDSQCTDTRNPQIFPKDGVKGCSLTVFEKRISRNEGTGARKLHRGYRLVLSTPTYSKTLSTISYDLHTAAPILCESNNGPDGKAAIMVIHLQEQSRQCRMQVVFQHTRERTHFFEALGGLIVEHGEEVVAQVPLRSLDIVLAGQKGVQKSALSALPWKEIIVINAVSETRACRTVLSQNLRTVIRHAGGIVTDRLDLGQGEMQIRVPLTMEPSLQIFRHAQEDMTVTIDARKIPPQQTDALTSLSHSTISKDTIRTLDFTNNLHMHAIQHAITGFTVRFDGFASLFAISRRRTVVSVYKRLEGAQARIQIVSQGNIVQLLAFFEDFSYADAMAIQLKSTDVYEEAKLDKLDKSLYGVKLVDAKFRLPKSAKEESEEEYNPVKGRFVNLEGLDYAEEHDDITIGFKSEDDLDRFSETLPAPVTSGKGITFMRRI